MIEPQPSLTKLGPRSLKPTSAVGDSALLGERTGRVGDSRAERMIEDLRDFGPSAPRMWAACWDFVASGKREAFKDLQTSLFIVAGGIPVAATFPAFMAPERFPMVDSWIAKWVLRYHDAYPADPAAVHLVAPSEPFTSGRRKTLVASADWKFYCGWIEWCRAAASVLSENTDFLGVRAMSKWSRSRMRDRARSFSHRSNSASCQLRTAALRLRRRPGGGVGQKIAPVVFFQGFFSRGEPWLV